MGQHNTTKAAKPLPQADLNGSPPVSHKDEVEAKKVAPVERCGVSVTCLRQFLQEVIALEDGLTRLTTAECLEKIVKPRTSTLQCSFVDWVRHCARWERREKKRMADQRGSRTKRSGSKEGGGEEKMRESPPLVFDHVESNDSHTLIGEATVFVSHAWRYPIRTVLETLLDFAETRIGKTHYFWFDLFTNNQWVVAQLPQEWYASTFKDMIGRIGCVALLLFPWEDPVPLKRAWCLWEIFSTIEAGAELHVVLPKGQIPLLSRAIKHNSTSVVNALSTIQGQKAEAFFDHDRTMIFQAIEQTIGFVELNSCVKSRLREWLVGSTTALVEELEMNTPAGEARLPLLLGAGDMLTQLGRLDQAEQLLRQAQRETGVLGKWHDKGGDWLRLQARAEAQTLVGMCLSEGAHHDNAEKEFMVALETFQLAENARQKGRFLQAEGGEGDEGHSDHGGAPGGLKARGDMRAHCLEGIGFCLRSKGKYTDALLYYQRSLDTRLDIEEKEKLRHVSESALAPSTDTAAIPTTPTVIGTADMASSYDGLGGCWRMQGVYDKALVNYQRAKEIRLQIFGDRHPAYAASLNNIANVHLGQGDAPSALTLYQQVYELEVEIFGIHPRIGRALNNMANAQMAHGSLDDALVSSRACLALYKKALGKDSLKVAEQKAILGSLFLRMGDFTEGLETLIESECHLKRLVADDHPSFESVYVGLAEAHEVHTGDAKEALRYWSLVVESRRLSDVGGQSVCDALESVAKIQMQGGMHAAAVASLEQALTLRPKSPTKEEWDDPTARTQRLLRQARRLLDPTHTDAPATDSPQQKAASARKSELKKEQQTALDRNLQGLLNAFNRVMRAQHRKHGASKNKFELDLLALPLQCLTPSETIVHGAATSVEWLRLQRMLDSVDTVTLFLADGAAVVSEKLVVTFVRSFAALFLAAHVFGLALVDLTVTPQGQIFAREISQIRILGLGGSKFGIKREHKNSAVLPEFCHVLGGKRYRKSPIFKAFLNLVAAQFELLHQAVPLLVRECELQGISLDESALAFLREKLCTEEPKEKNRRKGIVRVFNMAVDRSYRRVDNMIHNFKHK